MARRYCVIEIYTAEGVRCGGRRLSEVVLEYIRGLRTAARVVIFKGVEGCFETGEISTQRVLSLSMNPPVKMEIVLPAADAESVTAALQEMVCDGVVGSRELFVASHRTRKQLFPPQLRVKEVMTAAPATVRWEESADQVMNILLSANFTGVPVVDAQDKPMGVISQSDLIYRAGMPVRLALMARSDPQRLKSVISKMSEKSAREIMSRPAVVVCETDLLTTAVNRMLEKGVKRLPVVDGHGTLTGILSRMDIFQCVTREAPDWDRLRARDVHVADGRRVSEIMRRDIRTVGPETPLDEVLRTIDDNDIQRIAVVAGDGRLLGVISDRNLLSIFSSEAPGVWEVLSRLTPFSAKRKHAGEVRADIGDRQARDVMKTDLVTVRDSADIDEAVALMTKYGIRRLPVVDDAGVFKGMISREALLKAGFSAMKGL